MLQNMYTWCGLRNEGVFFVFFNFGAFWWRVSNWGFEGSIFNLFLRIPISRSNISMSNSFFKVSKVKKCKNHLLTNHGVFWLISKLIEIRDQGMGWGIFVLRFKICICGVGENLRVGVSGCGCGVGVYVGLGWSGCESGWGCGGLC